MKPFITCKGPDSAYQSSGIPSERLGYHAFFVSYIPFIPSFLSEEFTRMITGEVSRIKLIVGRQIRFLNDLCSIKSNNFETFDLRFISIPQPGQPYNQLFIFFIGKVFSFEKSNAIEIANNLWKKFFSFFPLEDPFNYPLRLISSVVDKEGNEVPSDPELIKIALEPLKLKDNKKWNFVEIRKFDDRDPLLIKGENESLNQFLGYFPHPFRPTLDYSAMSRFLETFTKQDQLCIASISLRPTTLSLEEQQHMNRMMQQYKQLLVNSNEAQNWLSLYRSERLADIERTFTPMINQRNHLFIFKIQILGDRVIPEDVVAALGSEIMNNSTSEPRMWSELIPQNEEELAIARKNFELVEYRSWKRPETSFPLWRLSSLVSSYEAVGAFRLPVPPESGHLPGVKVRDEPFVIPGELISEENKSIKGDVVIPIGKILHRGLVTETDYCLSLSQLKRHGLITGSTGSGKTNTCLLILTELWKKAKIPFLVIYPIDKPDYRLLKADKNINSDLLIFTLGDETTSPFRFNPLHVPDGILVRSHISLLMRAFSAAFSMWDPLPAIYRGTLRKLYREAGFSDLSKAKGGDPDTSSPILGRFYELLIETSDEMTKEYGKEVKGSIKQGSEIRIRDLLQNAGSVLNVKEGVPWNHILNHPTVMEVGRIGSTEDSSLVMGFLLMSLTSYLSSRRLNSTSSSHHITLIEEAHRLMSSNAGIGNEHTGRSRAQASEDFANILAEVRGFNESILIAEQIPTELVSGAIGNTFIKVMHWLEEQNSYELFSEIMNLNPKQREFARTLPTGQAIVRGLNAKPILVKINNYLDQFQNPDDSLIIDDSDSAIHEFMNHQISKFGINLPTPDEYFSKLFDTHPDKHLDVYMDPKMNKSIKTSEWQFSIPMQTCVFCEMMLRSNKCRYKMNVRGEKILANSELLLNCDPDLEKLMDDFNDEEFEEFLIKNMKKFEQYFNIKDLLHLKGHYYCFLAHRLNLRLFESAANQNEDEFRKIKMKVKKILLWSQKQVILNMEKSY